MQEIDPSVWRAPSAEVYGRVVIEAEASLWPGCVIRAECHDVHVGRMTNLQDGVVVHVGFDHPTRIGAFCSITHRAVVHGAVVEDDCLIGIGAVVMDGAVVGRGSIVAPGAVVTEGTVLPPGSVAAGVPARVKAERDARVENRLNAYVYHRNAEAYRMGRHRAWEGPGFEAWREECRRALERELSG